jgi:hypothetical protein
MLQKAKNSPSLHSSYELPGIMYEYNRMIVLLDPIEARGKRVLILGESVKGSMGRFYFIFKLRSLDPVFISMSSFSCISGRLAEVLCTGRNTNGVT